MRSKRTTASGIESRQPSGLGLLFVCVACAGGAAACTSSGNGNGGGGVDSGIDATATPDGDDSVADGSVDDVADATHVVGTVDGGEAGPGATTDASGDAKADSSADATPDALADGPTSTFCETQIGLDFCDDFDSPGALSLDGGAASGWTQIVGSPGELAISSARSVSAPNSLLVSLPNGPDDGGVGSGDRSAKVVKQLTPASGVSQAISEFDIYVASAPASASNPGGFATDLQFMDGNGADQFGFRIGVFANATGFDHADLEHNHPTLGGADDIVSPLTGFTSGAWNHIKMAVAFAAVDGGDVVHFQMYLNRSATAFIDQTYPAPFASAPFARIAAGVVFAFDATNKDWNINYDNFTLKVQ
jgi:hypothetical protein